MSIMIGNFSTKAKTDTTEALAGTTERQKNGAARRKLTEKVTSMNNAARRR